MIHEIQPSDNPQVIIDTASTGDLVRFLPGLHEHRINNNGHTQNSIIYIDKPLNIELLGGAILKLRDNEIPLGTEGEITTNQGVAKNLDDLSIGGTFTGTEKIDYYVEIDSQTNPNTFKWGVFTGWPNFDERANGVVITGDWQNLENGVQIKFDNVTGHNLGSIWYISYDGKEHYGIRVGEGFHTNYIEDVHIFGHGTIDLNRDNNVQPGILVANTSSCVLLHGRVRNILTEQITMKNSHRTFMAYGDATGDYQADGSVIGGQRFDAEKIDILNTFSYNYAPIDAGIEMGHPSHRGKLKFVRCNGNYIQALNTPIEPNFMLEQYEVLNNRIKGTSEGGYAIHCWRQSKNGLIMGNTLVDTPGANGMVKQAAPGGWGLPEGIITEHNYNLTLGSSTGGGNPNIPYSNMVLHLNYNNNTNDLTGTSNVTAYNVSFVPGVYSGRPNESGFISDATNSKIKVDYTPEHNFGNNGQDSPFTFCFVYAPNASIGKYLFVKKTSNKLEYQIIKGHNTDRIKCYLKDEINGGNLHRETTMTLSLNQPHVIFVSYDASATTSGIQIEIDGVVETVYNDLSTGTYVSMQNYNAPLWIGTDNGQWQQGADGVFDETMLFNRVLSQSEKDAIRADILAGIDI